MATGVGGDFYLRLSIGGDTVDINTEVLHSLTVIEYLDSMVPTLHMRIEDPAGALGAIILNDEVSGIMEIEFSAVLNPRDMKHYKFRIFRRKFATTEIGQGVVDLSGWLYVDNLFSPKKSRGSGLSVKGMVGVVANDTGVYRLKVSDGCEEAVALPQPNMTNFEYLETLRNRSKGTNGEVGFYVFYDCPPTVKSAEENSTQDYIIRIDGAYSPRLNFMSVVDYTRNPSRYKFVDYNVYLAGTGSDTDLPRVAFELADKGRMEEVYGVKSFDYAYFDFVTGSRVDGSIDSSDSRFLSLTDYIACPETSTGMLALPEGGASTTMVEQAEGTYFRRANSVITAWLTTRGLVDIACGDIVEVVFTNVSESDAMFDFSCNGFWMVSRVIHDFSTTYMTRLLLVRPGLDTGMKTSLIKATNVKKG